MSKLVDRYLNKTTCYPTPFVAPLSNLPLPHLFMYRILKPLVDYREMKEQLTKWE